MNKKIKSNKELEQRIYEVALNYLSYQERSKKEVGDRINQYLNKVDYLTDEDKSEIKENVLQALEEANLINDEKFAQTYVLQRIASPKPVSKKAMLQFFYKKGISKDVYEQALTEYTKDNETVAVEKIAEKKLKSLIKLDPKIAKQKLITYLYSKGFSSDVIHGVVDTKFKVH